MFTCQTSLLELGWEDNNAYKLISINDADADQTAHVYMLLELGG